LKYFLFVSIWLSIATSAQALNYSMGGGNSSQSTNGVVVVEGQSQKQETAVSNITEIVSPSCLNCDKKIVVIQEVQTDESKTNISGYGSVHSLNLNSYSQVEVTGYGIPISK
jgi:hypothetical protein